MTAVCFVWLRYGLLLGARAVRWLRHALFGGWRRPLIGFILTGAAVWLLDNLGLLHGAWRGPAGAVALFALIALLRWILHARRRLVIGNFVDYRVAEPRHLPGLSTLLQVELARLYGLIDVVDQSRAVPDILQGRQNVAFEEGLSLAVAEDRDDVITLQPLGVPAPVKAEDLTEVLDAALSVEATMSLGPVKIPIGALASLVGLLARGPRVSGSVHGDERGLVLTARTVGALRARTWRVDRPPATDADDRGPRPDDLVEELAVRIFTDLALEGSVKWQATSAYMEGLRAYRACLRTKQARRLGLERAKDRFIETIARDDRFDLAHYNLAVVATDLGQKEAAEAAYLAAIRLNKQRWAPYYGLAQLYFAENRYADMLPLCGRMLRLGHRAEAYHLRALSHRRSKQVAAAMKDRRASVRWSWLGLCRAAVRGDEADATQLAAISLRNLAGIRAYRAKDRLPSRLRAGGRTAHGRLPVRLRIGYVAAACELKQGRFLNPSDPELHFELGKIYAARRSWRRAARALEGAVEIVPDRPRFWIELARAYAGMGSSLLSRTSKERAVEASKRAALQPSQMIEEGFKRLESVYTELNLKEEAERMRVLGQFELTRRAWTNDNPTCEELEAMVKLEGQAPWEMTQICLRLAQRYLSTSDAGQASLVADRLADQLQELCQDHPAEVTEHEVYAVLAEALHAAGRDAEALRHAEAAVVHDPLSARARRVRAQVYVSLGHFEQATEAWRAALVSDPDGARTNLALGECLVRQALDSHERERRRSMLVEATGHLDNALKLSELDGPSHHVPDDRAEPGVGAPVNGAMDDLEGTCRFWLGRAYFELGDHARAATQFHLCMTFGYQPLLAGLRLGVAHLRTGHLCEGEHVLREARRLAESAPSSGEAESDLVGPPGDRLSVREVLAWARLYVAASQIERDAGLRDAIKDIRRVAAELGEPGDGRSLAGFHAACADSEGWAWYLLDDHERAIQNLQQSIRYEPTADAYLHLAQVHADRALDDGPPAQRQRSEARARHYAELARRMGLGSGQVKPLDTVMRMLDIEREGRWRDATANGDAPNGQRPQVKAGP